MNIHKKPMNKKGQVTTGLNVLLSLISMLFMIGIIVMVFVIAGAKLKDSIDDNTSKEVINKTYQSLSEVPDWFPTFIVLGSLVVLILLVVIIINSIRMSGMAGVGA